jgi:putative ABC transport system permease protein
MLAVARATLTADPELPEPQNLFHVYGWQQHQSRFLQLSYPDFTDMQRAAAGSADLAAFVRLQLIAKFGGVETLVPAEAVSTNYFSVLQVRPVLGSLFEIASSPADQPRVILGSNLWRSRFGADPKVVGSTVLINATPSTVVGVAPASFRGTLLDWGDVPQMWVEAEHVPGLPRFSGDLADRRMRMFLIAGRRRPASSLAAVESKLRSVAERLANSYPSDRDISVRAFRMSESRFWPAYRPKIRRVETMLECGALILLLLGVLNAAAIVWARCLTDARSYAARIALGGSALSIFRLVWLHALMLTLPGVAAGFAILPFAQAALTVLGKPFGIPLAIQIKFDWTTVAGAFGAAVVVSALVAALPTWDLSRIDIATVLRSRATLGTGGRMGIRYGILALQAGLSMVLLAAAGMAGYTLLHLYSQPLGFSAEHLSVIRFQMPEKSASATIAAKAVNDVADRMADEPGISSAAICWMAPLDPVHETMEVSADGPAAQQRRDWVSTNQNLIGAGYFKTLSAAMVLGSEFTAADIAGPDRPVILNTVLARKLFGASDPVHRYVLIRNPGEQKAPERFLVTAVAPEMKTSDLAASNQPYLYQPFVPAAGYDGALLVRGSLPSGLLESAVDRLWSSREGAPVLIGVTTMQQRRDLMLAPERTMALVALFFSVAAILVAFTGTFSATSRFVAENLKSLGIRLALGAPRGNVRWLVLKRALLSTGIGVLLAAGGLAALRAPLTSMLSGAAPYIAIVAAVACLQVFFAALAAFFPAYWGSRLDPVDLLRHE